MHPGTGFLKVYFYTSLLFGLLGLIDILLTVLLTTTPLVYAYVVSALTFLFFFFNITALIVFRHQRQQGIFYVLPVYHLISYIVFLLLGTALIIMGIYPEWLQAVLAAVSIAAAFFEIGFSFYLLRKMEYSPLA